MKYKVHKVQQAASSGSHVTIYEADLEFNSDRGVVQVFCPLESMDGGDGRNDEDDVQRVAEAIKRGAEKALTSRGVGAIIRVSRVVIHPIDFKPRKYEQYTTEELDRICEGGLL